MISNKYSFLFCVFAVTTGLVGFSSAFGSPLDLYTEDFAGNGDLSLVGWQGVYNGTSSAGVVNGFAWLWHSTNCENVIYTAEVQLPQPDGWRYLFNFSAAKHSSYNTSPRISLAVQVGGSWYVSKTAFAVADVNFQARTFVYDPAKEYWDNLNISNASRGSSVSSNLSGLITAFGFYSDSANMGGVGSVHYDFLSIKRQPSKLSSDIDRDRLTTLGDFSRIGQSWLASYPDLSFNWLCDIDNDGQVQLPDILSLAEKWLLGNEQYNFVSSNRVKMNFNLDWKYLKGNVAGDTPQNPSYDDSSWESVIVPHNPPLVVGQPDPARTCWDDPESYQYEGVSWYRKHFTVDSQYQDRKIFMEFEAVNTVAEVWVNGTKRVMHEGGYLPFTIDVTNHVNFGGTDNVVSIKADNTDDPEIPIGNAGWFNWGGIYRDVWIHITDKLHITDAVYVDETASGGIFVTFPEVSDQQANVQVQTHVANENSGSRQCSVITYLVNKEGIIVAQDESDSTSISSGQSHAFMQNMVVTSPNLWHPDTPYRYDLYTQVYESGILKDLIQTKVGIRQIAFTKNGFYINGEKLRLRGGNHLQNYPYFGYAWSNEGLKRDIIKLKEAGYNYLRLCQYPHDPAVFDACDEVGLCVSESLPGFQHFGSTPLFTNLNNQNARDMVRRDRNHPSIVLWELSLGEAWWNDKQVAVDMVKIGHEEYPGSQFYVTGWKDIGHSSWDFPAIYDVAFRNADHDPSAWNYNGPLPLIINEYGHWRYNSDWPQDSDAYRGDEYDMSYQAQNYQESHNIQMGIAGLCGDAVWTGFDYACYPQGLMDVFRLPKFAYYFYQSQRDPSLILTGLDSGPMVHIASYWKSDSTNDPLLVYSNCDEVKLYLNDTLIGTELPCTGTDCTNLAYPPFEFTGITWQSGNLRADGYISGQLSASHEVTTPGSASKINISFDTSGVNFAASGDIIFVHAKIEDNNGTLCSDFGTAAPLYVLLNLDSGPAQIVSPDQVQIEYGVATFLLRTTGTPGTITVSAYGPSVQSDTASIISH